MVALAMQESTDAGDQVDLEWDEQAGLVKFDFLGLKTLILQTAVALVGERGVEMSEAVPLNDEKTYSLLARPKRLRSNWKANRRHRLPGTGDERPRFSPATL